MAASPWRRLQRDRTQPPREVWNLGLQFKLRTSCHISKRYCSSMNTGSSTSSIEQLSSVDEILSHRNEIQTSIALKNNEQMDILKKSKGIRVRLRTLSPEKKKHLGELKIGAGVLIPLCTINSEPSVLYTLRTMSLGSHRGEVSFPGGNADKKDKDIIHTALREMSEEIGISSEGVNVWGTGLPLPTRNFTMMVTPVIANIGTIDLDNLTPNPREVEEIFHVPLKLLCDERNWRYTKFLTKIEQKGLKQRPYYVMPVFTGGKHRIWGMTAIITYLTLHTIAKGLFKFGLP